MTTDVIQTKEEQMECMRQRIVNQRSEINALLSFNHAVTTNRMESFGKMSLYRDKCVKENLALKSLLKANGIPFEQALEER